MAPLTFDMNGGVAAVRFDGAVKRCSRYETKYDEEDYGGGEVDSKYKRLTILKSRELELRSHPSEKLNQERNFKPHEKGSEAQLVAYPGKKCDWYWACPKAEQVAAGL
jgi:hypothetical protein